MQFCRITNLLAIFAIYLTGTSVSSAGFIISFAPADLVVNATGGMVNQSVDMFIRHDGIGSNLFSVYEIELNPAARVAIAEGPIATSDFVFDIGHAVLSSSPWSINGAGSVNNTVTFGGSNLLAKLTFSIDTSPGFPALIDLQPKVVNAARGGFGQPGSDITTELTITPASLSITAVPEPSSISFVATLIMVTAWRRRRRVNPNTTL